MSFIVGQSSQTGGGVAVNITGNTSGTTANISSGTMILAGGNNITLSQNANSITISAFSQTVQTALVKAAIIDGNTSGTTASISSGTLVLAGGNNITLSQVGNAVTISAFSQTVQTALVKAEIISGNTSGTTASISSGTMVLAGGNNITLSQNGNSVTISGGAAGVTVSQWNPYQDSPAAADCRRGSIYIYPVVCPVNVTADRGQIFLSVALGTAGTLIQAVGISGHIGVYTRSGSTLSLATSGSIAYAATNISDNSTSVISGIRNITVPFSANFAPGAYWIAGMLSTSTNTTGGANSFTVSSLVNVGVVNGNLSGEFGAVVNASVQYMPGWGLYSVTTASMPNSMVFADIIGGSSGTAQRSSPWIIFQSGTV